MFVLAAVAAAVLGLWSTARSARVHAEPSAGDGATEHGAAHQMHHPMSAADMERWVLDWYATHPRRGLPAPAGGVVDTFSVFSFGFDNDGNTSDGIDTAFVFVGQSVLWKLTGGGHTTTSGTSGADPSAGFLFDQPINSFDPEFAFEFTSAGTVPFFCRPHDGLMRGVVVVSTPTDVVPVTDRNARAGFAADPAPNPTKDSATFRFALREGGQARVEVYDVRGRRVAVAVDRVLRPGTYAASWNGRTEDGRRATAGVYYVRLTVPGAKQTREVVLTH